MNLPIILLKPSDSQFPQNLLKTQGIQFPLVQIEGDVMGLNEPWLGLFCSANCPGSLILKAYDLSIALQKAGTPLASGFHSPVEHDALKIALRGEQKILVCLARGLEGMRIPVAYRKPLDMGQLLLASIIPSKLKRPTAQTAYERNRFVAALAEKVLIIHAKPDSRLISLCQEVRSWGKTVYTLVDPANDYLVSVGVKAVSIEFLEDLMH